MFIDRPLKPNGLALVCDARFKYDRDLQEEEGGQPVMREWGFGKAVLGTAAWAGVTRIALYDYGADTEALDAESQAWVETFLAANPKRKRGPAVKRALAKQRTRIRTELRTFLAAEKFKCTLILQTRGADQKNKEDFGDAKGLKGTMGWTAMHAPDSLPEMAGCIWESDLGPIMPFLNPINYEHAHHEAFRRQLKGAFAAATGLTRVLKPDPTRLFTSQDESMEIALVSFKGKDIAVDIESYSAQDLITAVGISNGEVSVSVPWDAFTPYGANYTEDGASEVLRNEVRALLADPKTAKIFHNYTYDVPFLERKGVPVCGPIHDTFAMHGVVYKQWRHGLQRACASELLIPPWKSIWHPKHPPEGMDKDDAEWWILEPEALRLYNAKDAFYTYHLFQALRWKVGI